MATKLGVVKNILIFIAGGASLIAGVYGWDHYAKNFRDIDVYQALGEGLAESDLRRTVMDIESYKLIFGFYPSSIKEFRGNSLYSDAASGRECKCSTDYHYQLSKDGKTYFLFSKGRDCIAFTDDDIHPVLTSKQRNNIGLRSPTANVASQDLGLCNGAQS